MAMSVQHEKFNALRDAKFVIRRYVKENQCVLVWACQAVTEGSISKIKGVQVFDLGWTRIQPILTTSDDELSSVLIQSCARVKIKLPGSLQSTDEDVVFLTDLVTSSYLKNLVGVHQSVEDLLVEEAIKKAE